MYGIQSLFFHHLGAVDSNSNLVCEVVFYPSFHAPLSGKFRLNVENGNQLDLDAQAEVMHQYVLM